MGILGDVRLCLILIFNCPADSSIGESPKATLSLTHSLSEPPFDFDIKDQSQRLVTFETFDQSNEET